MMGSISPKKMADQSSTLFDRLFSRPQLLQALNSTAWRALLRNSPSFAQWESDEDLRQYYTHLVSLAYYREEDSFLTLLQKRAPKLGVRHLSRQVFAQLVENITKEEKPTTLQAELILASLLSYLQKEKAAFFFCFLRHDLGFSAVRLASFYGLWEHDFLMEVELIDLAALLLMGSTIYNPAEGRWYFYKGSIWEKVESKVIASYLLRQMKAFSADLLDVLESKSRTLQGDEQAEMDNKREFHRKFFRKANYNRMKSLLEPVEAVLSSKENILEYSREKSFLFYASNQVVFLDRPKVRHYRPDDYATFSSPTAYVQLNEKDDDARVGEQRFRYFIESFTSENPELEDFLRTWFGYGITGLTCEQQFLVIMGKGSNSKSIFVNLFEKTLGDYFSVLPRCVVIDTNKSAGGTTPHFNKLATVRLGAIVELKARDNLDIENIKNITGGDSLPSRGLYKNDYENIKSQTKLFFITNEMAKAKFSYAYARRVVIFPSKAKFIKGLRDEDKRPGIYPVIFNFDKLMQDNYVRQAFLRFLVEGARHLAQIRRAWGYSGIPAPIMVRKATEDYLSSINEVGRFLLDITDSIAHTCSDEFLYNHFKNWHLRFKNVECFKSLLKFNEELDDMGVSPNEEGEYLLAGDPNKLKARYPIF